MVVEWQNTASMSVNYFNSPNKTRFFCTQITKFRNDWLAGLAAGCAEALLPGVVVLWGKGAHGVVVCFDGTLRSKMSSAMRRAAAAQPPSPASASTTRRVHSTGSLQIPPLLRVAASPPPTETTVHKLMHFLLGLCVLATGVFTVIHVLLSLGVRVHVSDLFGAPTSPHHHADAILGLPTCARLPMEGGRAAHSALMRLPLAAHRGVDTATAPGQSIIRPRRYFYDSDAREAANRSNSSCGGAAVDAGVCVSGIAAWAAPGLRGGVAGDRGAGAGEVPLRCLPSLVLPGAMKVRVHTSLPQIVHPF